MDCFLASLLTACSVLSQLHSLTPALCVSRCPSFWRAGANGSGTAGSLEPRTLTPRGAGKLLCPVLGPWLLLPRQKQSDSPSRIPAPPTGFQVQPEETVSPSPQPPAPSEPHCVCHLNPSPWVCWLRCCGYHMKHGKGPEGEEGYPRQSSHSGTSTNIALSPASVREGVRGQKSSLHLPHSPPLPHWEVLAEPWPQSCHSKDCFFIIIPNSDNKKHQGQQSYPTGLIPT